MCRAPQVGRGQGDGFGGGGGGEGCVAISCPASRTKARGLDRRG